MSYITVEVDIDHGKILPRQPEKLPAVATGVLTIFQPAVSEETTRERIQFPLIRGDGKRVVNPTPQELDVSLWGE
jgi:hypothetical protein